MNVLLPTDNPAIPDMAAAICRELGFDPDSNVPEGHRRWRDYIGAAKAALDALEACQTAKTA